jgi:hypothetical protein
MVGSLAITFWKEMANTGKDNSRVKTVRLQTAQKDFPWVEVLKKNQNKIRQFL